MNKVELTKATLLQKVFIGLTSDFHFQPFCDVSDFPELKEDERLASNADRFAKSSWLVPLLKEKLATLPKADMISKSLEVKIPSARSGARRTAGTAGHRLQR
jgi:crotonobetainyl-CoA:carnitine CoA-transferase CaiB-like acyl-CoA transferase